MSLLAVIPGLAPGLLALLPQLLLLLFALVVVLLSPRTWWRALVYSVRRPQWLLGLVLFAGGCWFVQEKLSGTWPGPVAGKALPARVGEFSVGGSRSSLGGSRAQGPAQGVTVESYPLASPLGDNDLLAGERIFRVAGTGGISCARLADGEPLWALEKLEPPLFPLVLAGRGGPGRELPGYLLALSAAGGGTELRVIDADRGAVLAIVGLEDHAVEAPIVVDEMAVIACRGSLQALSLLGLPRERAAVAWKVPMAAGAIAALAGDENGHCLVLGENLFAVNIATGILVATANLGGLAPAGRRLELRAHRGLIYLFSSASGAGGGGGISCLELLGSSFEKRWGLETPAIMTTGFALSSDKLAYLTADGKGGGALHLVEAATGRQLPGLVCSRQVPLALSADLSACYMVLSDGGLSRFSHVRGREAWRARLGAGDVVAGTGSRPPLLRNGSVLVAGDRSVFLFAESEAGGEVGGWSALRGGAGRGGNSDPRRAPLGGKLLWRKELAGGGRRALLPQLDPVVVLEGNIVSFETGPAGGRLLYLGSEGEQLGELELGALPESLVSNGRRLFLSSRGQGAPGELLAVEVSAGKLKVSWRRPAPGARAAELCLLGDGCVVAGAESLVMVDTVDGEMTWERADLGAVEALCPSGRELVIARGRALLLVDAASGATLRTFPERKSKIRSVARVGGNLYLSSGLGREALLEAFSKDTGELLWKSALGGGPGAGVAAGEDCLVVEDVQALVSVAPTDGGRLSSFSSATGWRGAPALALGMAVAVDGTRLVAVDPVLGGELWSLELKELANEERLSSVSIIDGRIYLRSASELFCVGEEEPR